MVQDRSGSRGSTRSRRAAVCAMGRAGKNEAARAVCVTASRSFVSLIGAGATLIGAVFFVVGHRLRWTHRNFSRDVIAARVTIVKKFRKPGAGTWGGLENHFIAGHFLDQSGTPREVEVQVMSRAWRSLREGGTTTISYRSGEPERARFASALRSKTQAALGTFLMVIGVAESIFFLLLCLREFFRANTR